LETDNGKPKSQTGKAARDRGLRNQQPDQDQGWCEACNAGTMTSGLLLMGLI
jgi:hypothetical protein